MLAAAEHEHGPMQVPATKVARTPVRLRLPQHFVAPSLPLTKIRRVAFRDKPHTKSTALSPHVYLQGILLSGLRMRSAN